MEQTSTISVLVKGIVQGVGFRPFVYHLANQFDLKGWVLNSSKGVELEVTGTQTQINSFIHLLQNNPPPLARIDSFIVNKIDFKDFVNFKILESVSNSDDFLPISPDFCLCEDCLREMFDPNNRRFRYPFINCTNCGPRFSIIQDIPYDRPFTTMSEFGMCEDCRNEYENPNDRRFNAQPTACPVCGPEVSFFTNNGQNAKNEEAIQLARTSLIKGNILAVKGLGGYHLACDAFNANAINKLRLRKKRSNKPFALMSNSLQNIKKYCEVSIEEQQLLLSVERPIVLLEKRKNIKIPEGIAPGQNTLGVMLPYTPIHYLLMQEENDFPDLLVMTSGNFSDEPIAYQDIDAKARLSNIADAFLNHNRSIHMRIDDSVSRIIQSRPFMLRRSRGYAPNSMVFLYQSEPILATGPELKNTFCLTRDNQAFLSHHIGDMENLETLESFEEAVAHYEKLFRIAPKKLACDLHPDYLATRYAISRSKKENLPIVYVQHHHAHLAACIAENSLPADTKVIGLCFDGTGYGTDHAIWGGEVLIGNISDYQRRFHLKYVPLPGGDISIKIPARMALTHLWANEIDWEPVFPPSAELCYEEKTALNIQLSKSINAPLTSSMGRLFDAVASFIGIRHRVSFEGQAAIEMETLVDPSITEFYSYEIHQGVIDPAPLWSQLTSDLLANLPKSVMASKFHNSISQLCLDVCQEIFNDSKIKDVALSGGVWQNKVLLNQTITLLRKNKFNVFWHSRIPTNDGGISFGQACVAATLNRL